MMQPTHGPEPIVQATPSGTRKRRSTTTRSPAAPSESPTPAPTARLGSLPEGVTQVLDLFRQHSDTLQFPGVDATSLASGVEHLEQLAFAVAQARAGWEAAQAAYREAEAQLMASAERGYAYAEIYARQDEALSSELQSFVFARRTEARRGKTSRLRRGTHEEPRGAAAARSNVTDPGDESPAAPRSTRAARSDDRAA